MSWKLDLYKPKTLEIKVSLMIVSVLEGIRSLNLFESYWTFFLPSGSSKHLK